MATFGLVFLGIAYRIALPERASALRPRVDVWLPLLIWLFVVFTGFYSRHLDTWWAQVRLLMPFFALPLVFFWLPPLSPQQHRGLHLWLILLVLLAAISTGSGYFLHHTEWLSKLSQGQSIEPALLWIKPIDHIRFSLLLAFSALCSAFFFIESLNSKTEIHEIKKEYRLIYAVSLGFCSLILIVTLHLLAVRSGLLAFYVTAIVAIFWWIIYKKRIFSGIFTLILLAGLPIIAFKTMPSVAAKFYYSRWDIDQLKVGNLGETSDAGRITSILTGIYMGNSSPIGGVGFGDIEMESIYQYARHFPRATTPPLSPHNQFIYVYAGAGLLGLGLFLSSFLVSSWCYRQNKLFLLAWCVVLCSYLTESTLATSLGVTFVSFFMGIAANLYKQEGMKQ